MNKPRTIDETGVTYIQVTCDICGKSRNTREHRRQQKCSQIRQRMYRRAS